MAAAFTGTFLLPQTDYKEGKHGGFSVSLHTLIHIVNTLTLLGCINLNPKPLFHSLLSLGVCGGSTIQARSFCIIDNPFSSLNFEREGTISLAVSDSYLSLSVVSLSTGRDGIFCDTERQEHKYKKSRGV